MVDRVLGIDSNTNSMAFCLFDGKPLAWGKIEFSGKNVYDKILDARLKTQVVLDIVEEAGGADIIAIESAVMVRSNDVAIKMAMVLGAIIGTLRSEDNEVASVAPITWQSYIGNKNYTRSDKNKMAELYPGRSRSWYRAKIRSNRKAYTMQYFNNMFDLEIDDDDVGDSFGIAYHCWKSNQ